jgi:predicted alpha-1,2-mannosidase
MGRKGLWYVWLIRVIAEIMLPKVVVLIALLCCVASAARAVSTTSLENVNAQALSHPEEFVNILGGTDSRYDLSHGSTLPLIAVPWGSNSYAPQTDDDSNYQGWWFHPSDRRFFGLRVTHQPSPWISDYGNFLIKGYMPASTATNSGADQFTGYSPKTTVYSPYFYETNLMAYSTAEENTRFSFTPSAHGGIARIKFPKYDANAAKQCASAACHVPFEHADSKYATAEETAEATAAYSGFVQTRRISFVLHGGSDASTVSKAAQDGTVLLTGHTSANSGGVGGSEAAFAHYFAAQIYGGEDGDVPLTASSFHADSNGVYVDFVPTEADHELLTVRFATSFISQEQAQRNLDTEVGSDKSFNAVVDAAKTAWNKALSRTKITSLGDEKYTPSEAVDQYTKFYSALYRASLFPRSISETAADGSEVHWSPYATSTETRTAAGPLSTDSGFWDAWNTVYPLLTLVNRPKLASTLQGWLNAYKEGGWVPQWASPGPRGSMVGTMGDVSIADAIVKEIPGFDVNTAYEAIRKDAFEAPPAGSNSGRDCLDLYVQQGYVPRGACSEVVARTLNYYQADWAIAQAATKLGKTSDASTLLARAGNYTLLFNPESAFFRSRSADGKFTEPFDQFGWGGDYTEGGPYQYRFYLPYDQAGLDAQFAAAGKDMCAELEAVHTARVPAFHIGGYGSEIHEMTEMVDHCWGQYAHNNQPIHHQLYMGMFKGYTSKCAANAQARIRQVLNQLYTSGADMFAGDEDNGEMGAWYVLSSLGLYNLSPGSEGYLFGAPQFGSVELDISDDPSGAGAAKLHINAVNNTRDNVYVQRITWNGADVPSTENGISYAQLRQGGTLTFYMGPAPVAAHK